MAFKPNFKISPKKPQVTELGIQQTVGKFLRSNDLAVTPENTKILRDGIDNEHDGWWDVENLRAVFKKHRNDLRRAVTIKTLPRVVSVQEMQSMLKMILSANPWIADTDKNGVLVAATFLDDPRISPKRNLGDMLKAVEIVKAQLDVNKPAPPPKPQYDEGQLEDWQLPINAPTWMQVKATREQQRDFVQRLRRFESWKKQNEQ